VTIEPANDKSEVAELRGKIKRAELWMIWLTGAIALFGLGTVIVGGLQWRAIKGQLTLLSGQLDEMQLDQRPWLTVRAGNVKMSGGGSVSIPMILGNSGKTPANHVSGWIVVQPHAENASVDFRDPTEQDIGIGFSKFSTGVVFSNESVPQYDATWFTAKEGKPFTGVWTEGMQADFAKGNLFLEVHARFKYFDSHGVEHWTQFCATSGVVSVSIANQCFGFTDVDDNKEGKQPH
jgi:hypothetical protein